MKLQGERQSIEHSEYQENQRSAYRFCLPAAASPSSFSTSSFDSLDNPASAPVRFDVIRAGVTDLGKAMICLANCV